MASSVIDEIHSRENGFLHSACLYIYRKINSPSRPESVAHTIWPTSRRCISFFTTPNCFLVFSITRRGMSSGSMGSVSMRHALYLGSIASGSLSATRCPSAHVTIQSSDSIKPSAVDPEAPRTPSTRAMSRATDGFSASTSVLDKI